MARKTLSPMVSVFQQRHYFSLKVFNKKVAEKEQERLKSKGKYMKEMIEQNWPDKLTKIISNLQKGTRDKSNEVTSIIQAGT